MTLTVTQRLGRDIMELQHSPRRLSEEPEEAAGEYSPLVSRLLALGFGGVSVVAVVTCVVLMSAIADLETHIEGLRSDEAAMRESLHLAMAVREQYIHQAHSMIEGSPNHLDHYAEWVAGIEAGLLALRGRVPSGEVPRLDRLSQGTRALDRLFRRHVVPAIRLGRVESLGEVHEQMEPIAGKIAEDADAIVEALGARASRAHYLARRGTRRAMIEAAGCAMAALLLGAFFAWRIRRAVLLPLRTISAAATRFGRGNFEQRVGGVGEGEFGAVALAFNRMVRELRAREQRLLASERMAAIGQIAAGVAHEINNPIAVIRGCIGTMLPEASSDQLRRELEMLDEEAAVCQRIAEDLLACARPEKLVTERVQLHDLVASTVDRFATSGRADRARLSIDVVPGVIEADSARLRQVLINLLRNAIQASPVEGTVTVEGRPAADGGYVLSVIDQGDGIDSENKERVFEPFFTTTKDGAGLGLTISRGIVDAHGGRISVVCPVEGGARLEITLPADSPRTASDVERVET